MRMLLHASLVLLSCALCASAKDSATLSVKSAPPLATVEPNMVSFSFEISGVTEMMGRVPDKPKQSFIALLANLQKQSGKAGPTIRIGGNSADESLWNPSGTAAPAGTHYNITQDDLDSYKQFLEAAVGTRLVIDTTLEFGNTTTWAVQHVAAVGKTLPWSSNFVEAVEIGNEVDLFAGNGIRPPSYTYDDYEKEFDTFSKDLVSKAGMPAKTVQGATFCCGHFDEHIESYIDKFHDRLKTFSYHNYPTSDCGKGTPTLDELLADKSTTGPAERFAPWAKHARSKGIPFRIGEGNSCSCGGLKNVSDVMGTALWAVDYLFSMSAVNVSMMNFHGGGEGPYTAIGYNSTSSQVPDVRPLYYAMWLFTEVTRDASAIYEVDFTTTVDNMKAWVVKDTSDVVRVVVIHKTYNATDDCIVTVDLSGILSSIPGSATLYTLENTSKSVYAKYGLSWAGQTYDGTTDGTPRGKRVGATIPSSDGKFYFGVHPATIAVLEVGK